jgi:restriction endonuclease S subunit
MIAVIKNELNNQTGDDSQYTYMYGIMEVDQNGINKKYLGDIFIGKNHDGKLVFNYTLMDELTDEDCAVVKKFIKETLSTIQAKSIIYFTYLDDEIVEKFGFVKMDSAASVDVVNQEMMKKYELNLE